MYHEDPPPSAVPCPRCTKPALYVRTRIFETSESRVWMCENPHCQGAGLYFHTDGHPKQAIAVPAVPAAETGLPSADKQKALLAQFEIEKIIRETGLPALVFIGTPDDNGCTRASNGMVHAGNRQFMLVQILDYFEKFDRGELAPPT